MAESDTKLAIRATGILGTRMTAVNDDRDEAEWTGGRSCRVPPYNDRLSAVATATPVTAVHRKYT